VSQKRRKLAFTSGLGGTQRIWMTLIFDNDPEFIRQGGRGNCWFVHTVGVMLWEEKLVGRSGFCFLGRTQLPEQRNKGALLGGMGSARAWPLALCS
jgi:hypothetical protein